MTRTRTNYNTRLLPWYTKLGNKLKQFPQGLAQGSENPPSSSGAGAAALISAAIGCFLLMVNQHFTSVFKTWENIIWSFGDWIPGSKNPDQLYGEIGSYSGKETVLLVAWLGSWLFLSWFWRDRDLKTGTIFSCLFFLLVAATVMNWHPLFPYMPLMPK